MKKQLQILTRISLTLAAAGVGLLSYGQKLKTVQEASVYAPANVKVDGKMTEWTDFQAYNKTTDLFYTLSNDDKNLYLAVKSTSQQNNNKIMAGGINLTVNTADKKKDKDAFVLTFPLINRANRGDRGQRGAGGAGGFGGGQRGGGGAGGFGGGRQPMDSAAIANMRKTALAAIKEIKVFGFKDIQDSVISIYNEYGIKAAADYDDKGAFVYELSVPLKLLNLDVATAKEFAYNIKVNGLTMNRNDGGIEVRGEGGGGGFGGAGGGGGGFGGGGGGRGGGGGGGGGGARGGGGAGGGGRGGAGGGGQFNIQDMTTPTDFWGKYILAKK